MGSLPHKLDLNLLSLVVVKCTKYEKILFVEYFLVSLERLIFLNSCIKKKLALIKFNKIGNSYFCLNFLRFSSKIIFEL